MEAKQESAKHMPYLERSHPAGLGGTQWLYRFPNGYGASVVEFPYNYGAEYGLKELAVIRFDGDDWHLCYTTPITKDVLGHLSDDEVTQVLDQIEALPTGEAS